MLHIDTMPYAPYYGLIAFTLLAVILIFGCKNLYESEERHKPTVLGTICLSVLAVWCVVSLSGVSTFLYFNF